MFDDQEMLWHRQCVCDDLLQNKLGVNKDSLLEYTFCTYTINICVIWSMLFVFTGEFLTWRKRYIHLMYYILICIMLRVEHTQI